MVILLNLKKFNLKKFLEIRNTKVFAIISLIILLAILFRIPFFVYDFSLINSDDAVMILMGKHISEGKTPPVSFYGQHRLGSLLAHFYALMFKLFGYSILVAKLSSLFFYLGFILIQFLLIQRITDKELAVFGCIFLSLPIGDLIKISLDSAAGFSLMLFLGSLIIYITYLIYFKNKLNLLPTLGFLMGLSFWSHQINIFFIITSLIFLFLKFRFINIKKYLLTAMYFALGCFPLILYEIFTNFATFSIIFSGEKFALNWIKFEWFFKKLGYLIFLNSEFEFLSVILLVLSFMFIAIYSIKNKNFLPLNFYSVFLLVFLIIYFSSSYSNKLLIRYLYPLYFAFPLFIFLPSCFIRKKLFRYLTCVLILVIVLIPTNIHFYKNQIKIAKTENIQLKEIMNFIKKTGEKYWLSDYWGAYLLTCLAEEKIIVVSYSVKRYFPYQLEYYNNRKKSNFLFIFDNSTRLNKIRKYNAIILQKFLKKADIRFKKKKFDKALLIYSIKYPISPRVMISPLPPKLPELIPEKIIELKNSLKIIFRIKNSTKIKGFRANLSIPRKYHMCLPITYNEKRIEFDIPFKLKNNEKIFYYLDLYGVPFKGSVREVKLTNIKVESGAQKNNIFPLRGLTPVTFQGKRVYFCAKRTDLIIYNDFSKIILKIYSPFNFSSIFWYGNYNQQFLVYINKRFIGKFVLKDELNKIEINLKEPCKKLFTIVTLKFKYVLPFNYENLYWCEGSALIIFDIKFLRENFSQKSLFRD